jgi:uncharacterized membrane protein
VKASTGLALLLGGVGSTHLRKPHLFDAIVPRGLPGPARAYTVGSALVEFALAAGLVRESTRCAAGFATAAFLVVVFPANLQMALDGGMPGYTGLLGTGRWPGLGSRSRFPWSGRPYESAAVPSPDQSACERFTGRATRSFEGF